MSRYNQRKDQQWLNSVQTLAPHPSPSIPPNLHSCIPTSLNALEGLTEDQERHKQLTPGSTEFRAPRRQNARREPPGGPAPARWGGWSSPAASWCSSPLAACGWRAWCPGSGTAAAGPGCIRTGRQNKVRDRNSRLQTSIFCLCKSGQREKSNINFQAKINQSSNCFFLSSFTWRIKFKLNKNKQTNKNVEDGKCRPLGKSVVCPVRYRTCKQFVINKKLKNKNKTKTGLANSLL